MIWGCKRCVPKWCPRFCSKIRSRTKSNFVKTCWRKLKMISIFLGDILGDETWVFQYNLVTKRQSMQWKTAESPRPKKVHMSKSKIKVMLIAFFNQKGMVHHEFVPEGETVNQHFYQQVLIHLHNPV